ncbi:MAG: class I tRNA ligase family protein, partial [Bacteroidales bacterium]|nr:class I tRNA ligase family protein [Bacteroidales bacterium]
MDPQYDHKKYESDIYHKWESSSCFEPKGNGDAFTIIMPPPNANDPLHIGHARYVTIEDALIRYHRMKGDQTLWLPGSDHAGIETQYVFEKKLSKDGKSRFDFDHDTLYKMIWDYV